MNQNTPDNAFAENFLPVAGVALAGIIQVSSGRGPFSLWNVMLGFPLVLLLGVYQPHKKLKFVERLAWSATWGLTTTSTFGVGFQAAYRWWYQLPGLMPPFYDTVNGQVVELTEWEASQFYYFRIWILLSVLAYAVFWRPRSLMRRLGLSS